MRRLFRLAMLILAATVPTRADLVDLVDESFTSGFPNNQPGVTWTSSASTFERYGSGGAGVRDMNSMYDHDQDSGTADILIPGAIEVNSNATDVDLDAVFVLPSGANHTVDGTLSFFAGLRTGDAGDAPTVSVINITDGTTLLVESAIAINANDNVWEFSSLAIKLSANDLGDTLRLRFTGGGSNTANGLELTGVRFQVTAPEPTAFVFMAIGTLAATSIRRRRKA